MIKAVVQNTPTMSIWNK